jgi:hypothetical protein
MRFFDAAFYEFCFLHFLPLESGVIHLAGSEADRKEKIVAG